MEDDAELRDDILSVGGGKSLSRVGNRGGRAAARAAEEDGESSGWDDEDVRPLLTRGCKAVMALSDVLKPAAFKVRGNFGTSLRLDRAT